MNIIKHFTDNSGIKEKTILKFAEENLDASNLSSITESPEMEEFVKAIKDGDDLRAMAAYKKAKESSMDEARLATILTKKLLS